MSSIFGLARTRKGRKLRQLFALRRRRRRQNVLGATGAFVSGPNRRCSTTLEQSPRAVVEQGFEIWRARYLKSCFGADKTGRVRSVEIWITGFSPRVGPLPLRAVGGHTHVKTHNHATFELCDGSAAAECAASAIGIGSESVRDHRAGADHAQARRCVGCRRDLR